MTQYIRLGVGSTINHLSNCTDTKTCIGKTHFSIWRHSVNRFTWAIIITNHNTVYALRDSVAEGGEGEKGKSLFTSYPPASVDYLRNYLRKSSYVYNSS